MKSENKILEAIGAIENIKKDESIFGVYIDAKYLLDVITNLEDVYKNIVNEN